MSERPSNTEPVFWQQGQKAFKNLGLKGLPSLAAFFAFRRKILEAQIEDYAREARRKPFYLEWFMRVSATNPKKNERRVKGGIAFFLTLVEVSDRHTIAVAGRELSGAK